LFLFRSMQSFNVSSTSSVQPQRIKLSKKRTDKHTRSSKLHDIFVSFTKPIDTPSYAPQFVRLS
jgi:hypothetical protein